jgi:glucose-6-phosphate 1-dehydrogenase
MAFAEPACEAIVLLSRASGDLAQRKILPALYNLARDGLLHERFAVVGYARSVGDDATFRERARNAVERFSRRPLEEERWRRFAEGLFYVAGDFEQPGAFAALHERLARIEEQPHDPWAALLLRHPTGCVRDDRAPPGRVRISAKREDRAREADRARPRGRP